MTKMKTEPKSKNKEKEPAKPSDAQAKPEDAVATASSAEETTAQSAVASETVAALAAAAEPESVAAMPESVAAMPENMVTSPVATQALVPVSQAQPILVKDLASLEQEFENLRYNRAELIETTLREIEFFERESEEHIRRINEQIERRKNLLREHGYKFDDDDDDEAPASVKLPLPKPAGKAAGRGRPRGENTDTYPGGAEKLCLKHKNGLTAAEVTSKMITELGFKLKGDTAKDIADFGQSVYTGGIHKLTKQGTLVVVPGTKPKRYMHKENAAGKPWYISTKQEEDE